MRIVSWNINSIRTRIDSVLEFLEHRDVDVLCLQETKCSDDQFPTDRFQAAGYEVAHHGTGGFNGVAIVSRVGLEPLGTDLGQPGFNKDLSSTSIEQEPRSIGARCAGVDIWSLYIPNGREISDPHYTYKLQWLDAVTDYAASRTQDPKKMLTMVGDFNIIPADQDAWDPKFFEGKTHATPRERATLDRLATRGGLQEVTKPRTPGAYTYWDYQAGRFQNNQGIRIDFHYDSPALAHKVSEVAIDTEERSKTGTSDHAPVIVDYSL